MILWETKRDTSVIEDGGLTRVLLKTESWKCMQHTGPDRKMLVPTIPIMQRGCWPVLTHFQTEKQCNTATYMSDVFHTHSTMNPADMSYQRLFLCHQTVRFFLYFKTNHGPLIFLFLYDKTASQSCWRGWQHCPVLFFLISGVNGARWVRFPSHCPSCQTNRMPNQHSAKCGPSEVLSFPHSLM